MHIAFINATRKWGGVKTWTLDFAERLAAFGHDVRVYGRQPEFVAQARQRVGHGERADFGCDLNPAAVARFLRAFRRQRTDIVVLNIGKDLATAGVAARLLGIPVVQRIGLPEDIPQRFKTRLLHAWIRPAFLCPCRFIADGFARSLPYVDPADVHVVLNGKTPTTAPLATHAPRRLIATQQLNPDKGHETLLRALSTIDMPFELHVVGTGSDETRLRGLAASLGLAERVLWHGFSTDVPGLLAQADIFLLASRSEGLPNTLLEALAQGLLPVSRDVGGVREVFTPQLEPWLLPPDAGPEAFATVLRTALALSDDALLAARQASLEACRTRCDLDAKARELECWLADQVTAYARRQ